MTRSISVDVEIDVFPDDAILAAAYGIIRSHKQEAEPPKDGYRYRSWAECEKYCEKIAAYLAVDFKTDYAPPSTASRIGSLEELRRVVATTPLFGGQKPDSTT